MNDHPNQFEYLGRWVDTKHFCAFVYSKTEQKLAKNYTEYTDLIGSGLWFPARESALKMVDSTTLEAKNDKNPLKIERQLRKNHFSQLSKQGK